MDSHTSQSGNRQYIRDTGDTATTESSNGQDKRGQVRDNRRSNHPNCCLHSAILPLNIFNVFICSAPNHVGSVMSGNPRLCFRTSNDSTSPLEARYVSLSPPRMTESWVCTTRSSLAMVLLGNGEEAMLALQGGVWSTMISRPPLPPRWCLAIHCSRDTRVPCLAHRRALASPDVIFQASPAIVGRRRVIFD